MVEMDVNHGVSHTADNNSVGAESVEDKGLSVILDVHSGGNVEGIDGDVLSRGHSGRVDVDRRLLGSKAAHSPSGVQRVPNRRSLSSVVVGGRGGRRVHGQDAGNRWKRSRRTRRAWAEHRDSREALSEVHLTAVERKGRTVGQPILGRRSKGAHSLKPHVDLLLGHGNGVFEHVPSHILRAGRSGERSHVMVVIPVGGEERLEIDELRNSVRHPLGVREVLVEAGGVGERGVSGAFGHHDSENSKVSDAVRMNEVNLERE
mmetsp:Transcript_34431/g.55444  ORF Transcript_34431/g.55444 Transcript_34431/m.55444 type:complete len:261 (-) Transcript_34431:2104-2886(-)